MGIREIISDKGIDIRFEKLSPGLRGCSFVKGGKRYILVNENDPFERQNFTIAHEYYELILDEEPHLTLDEKHRLANRKASELLLPKNSFGDAVHSCDLHELKTLFPETSFEVIARRMIYFLPVVITIFDNESCTSRFGSDTINYPKKISPPEMTAAQQCYDTGDTVNIKAPPLNISAYYLDETNGIRRVIVVAVIEE